MIKSIIEVNGAKISIETESTNQFIDIVKGLENKSQSKKEVVHRQEKKTYSSNNEEYEKYCGADKKPWLVDETKKIVEMIVNNPDLSITKMIRNIDKNILNNHGQGSIVSYTAKVRRFIVGIDKFSITKKTKAIIKSLGYDYGSLSKYGEVVRKRNGKKSNKSNKGGLSHEAVVTIARMIRSNLDDTRVVGEVLKYLKNIGEERSKTSVYTFTSNLRLYFKTGKKVYLSQAHRDLLNTNGVYPVNHSTTNYLGNDIGQRDIVQTGIDGNPILRRVIPVREA